MDRKRRANSIRSIAWGLILIGLIVLLVFENSGKLVTLIATLTTIIGAFSVYIQMRKGKLVGQSSFTIEISKYLYETQDIADFIHRLGRASDVENREYVVNESERTLLVKYLNYIKVLAALVEERAVNVETLNRVFAYEFFIILNNKSVQEMEISPFAYCYNDVFELYRRWTAYLAAKNIEILHSESALSEIAEYKEYIARCAK